MVLKFLNKIARIIFILFIFIGILMLFQSIRNLFRIHKTEDWKQTEAFVDSIYVVKDGDSFFPAIQFNYEVNGRPYYGNRLTMGSSAGYKNEWWAMNEAESYLNKEDNSLVLIYYDPDNPESSTILRGKRRTEYELLFYGIVFLFIGLAVNKKIIITTIKRLRGKA